MKYSPNIKKLLSEAVNRGQRRTIILFISKLGFERLTVSEKVIKARHIIDKMTDNPNFTTPSPSLASVDTLADTLEAAEAAMDGRLVKILERDAALFPFTLSITNLQAYVENVSSKDKVKIASSGFEIRNAATKAVILPPPSGLTCSSTKIEGQVKLKFDSVRRKLLNVIQATLDAPVADWKTIAESSKSTVIVEGLIPGERYRFRIAVINVAGQSGWSDEVVCRSYLS